MASVSFAQNTYAGEVLEDLLTYTAQGNDTYKEGLIHIKSGIQYKYTLPSVSLGDIIQDNKPTPTSPTDSKGTYTFRERYLEPKDFMVYLEFNPRDFEKYWKFAQPDGNLVFRELDPKVLSSETLFGNQLRMERLAQMVHSQNLKTELSLVPVLISILMGRFIAY